MKINLFFCTIYDLKTVQIDMGHLHFEFFLKHEKWPNCGHMNQTSAVYHIYLGAAEVRT